MPTVLCFLCVESKHAKDSADRYLRWERPSVAMLVGDWCRVLLMKLSLRLGSMLFVVTRLHAL